ncbi:DnaJ like subfamily C member 1 [Pseudolycoriella hygida]|uniref:DnaJ like subfamily C member 1 n=1 Tax=Pseudolycoriella hygida TaxID=35572 RepID=A0A9Q0MUN7_9DIPT|nr:DnaJ like subfamily C member 1 [Pseudolycoriella hygida]
MIEMRNHVKTLQHNLTLLFPSNYQYRTYFSEFTMRIATLAILIYLLIHNVGAWDTEELEIFDLVEEINQNFYNVLGVQQDASLSEIKRAFRNLSVILHPDKSDAEDANVQFRNLVSVYEVLKDSSKREKYNEVLKNGLPNWKSALYYYRRVRKMGLAEMSFIVFMIITIGQYIVAWAAYAEKKYTAETMLGSRLKKLQKKNKTNVDLDTILSEIPVPSIFNTLPFQIPKLIWNIPRKESKKEGIRKRKEKFAAKEKTDAELQGYSKLNVPKGSAVTAVNTKEIFSGGFWTDEDLTELVRLVKKYPGGTPARWEVIAEMMNRSVQEITFMAAKMKENGYRVPGHAESVAENIVLESKKLKTKRPANPIIVPETTWTQEQQQLLELAIVKYPKTTVGDRWVKISNTIPGKTKEECLARYKHLVEVVKAQKERTQTEEQSANEQVSSSRADNDNVDEVAETNVVNEEEIEEPVKKAQNKGKPKNKRKERKNRMEFSMFRLTMEEDLTPYRDELLSVDTTDDSIDAVRKRVMSIPESIMSDSEQIIFDTDMGTDDAWALFMLLKAEAKYNVKLLGVTIVQGNTGLENATENALRVLTAAKRLDISVYKGAAEPLVKDFQGNYYHGVNGFGDVTFATTCDSSLVSSESALSFIYRMVKDKPKQITLICVGPLTNIALAMKIYPDFSELVKDIYIMGGNYKGIGNCTSESAEFNFYSDPEAAYVVFNKTKCKLTVLPWEACMEENHNIPMSYRFNDIANVKSFVTDLMNPVDDAIYKPKNKSHWNPCDAFLTAVFLEKEKVVKESKDYFATVELNGEMTRGQVAIYHVTGSQKKFNVTMIEAVDSDVCKEMLMWTAMP